MQWLVSFASENKLLIRTVTQSYIDQWVEHFAEIGMQLDLKDICYFLALKFKSEITLTFDGIVQLLSCTLACCSNDMSKNNLKLDLDFVLSIKLVETLSFVIRSAPCSCTFFEFLNTNIDKISSSDDFIKKVFCSKLESRWESQSFPQWILAHIHFCLNDGKDLSDETRNRLLSFQAAIDFMLKNSLTKATKEDENNFVVSLALGINKSVVRDLNTSKLAVEFVLKILKDNKMADREKLFLDKLVPELRPEMISIEHEPEHVAPNLDAVKSTLNEEPKLGGIESNLKPSDNVNLNSENSHIATNQATNQSKQRDLRKMVTIQEQKIGTFKSKKYKVVDHNFTKWERFKIWLYRIFVWSFVKLYSYLKVSKKNILRKTDVKMTESAIFNENQSISGHIKKIDELNQFGFAPKIEIEQGSNKE